MEDIEDKDYESKESKSKEEQEILTEALKRFDLGIEAQERDLMLEDLLFSMGDQWPEQVRKSRESANRPCLTINRVQQMVKQVVNDMRQNRAGIKVAPSGNGASKETAKIIGGLIRQIEASSDAPDQYVSAAENAVQIGIGYFRILPEYEKDSFDQNIRIVRIRNPFSVVLDPDDKSTDGSGIKWGFIIDDMPKEDFERMWPGVSGQFDEAGIGETTGWVTQDYVRVAEYYAIEEEEDTLYMLTDGSKIKRSEMPADPPDELVAKKRKCYNKKCVWRKMISTKILETTEYKTSFIPIIPVYGEEYDVEGVSKRMGIVRHAKDPQRIYNYSRTSVVEQITLAPKAPFVAAVGQVEGLEHIWKTANTENHSYLPYNPTTVAGQAAPAPQRQPFAGVPAGAMADLSLASDEIKAVTGIYDAALGQRSNETSGKAIMARQREADNATYHYVDNFNRAIKLCGRQLVELIPIIYDTSRAVQIIGEDGKEEMVHINQPDLSADTPVKNDLSIGNYEVAISIGPSYETKRIEAVNSMTSFMQAVPNAAPVLADLIAKNMDWPGAEQIARRLQALLPPEVLNADQDGEIPPAIMAQVNEMDKIIKDLQNALQEQMGLNADLLDKSKQEDRKLDIDAYKASTERMVAVMGNLAPEADPKAVEAIVMSTMASLLVPAYTPVVETGNPAEMMGQAQPTAPEAGPLQGEMQ